MIKLGKANYVSATSTAVAVEQAFARIDHEARMMILMQWAESHPPAAAELPWWPPIMCLEIIQHRNLPLQFVESLASHGLFASSGRIRQNAARSQATMVGPQKSAAHCCRHQHHTLSNRREPIGVRWMRPASVRGPCSAVLPARRNPRRRSARTPAVDNTRLKCPDGISQSGKTVKVFLHGRQIPRRTQMHLC